MAGATLRPARWLRRLRRQIAVGRHQTRIARWLLTDILRFSRWGSLRVVLTELLGVLVRYGSLACSTVRPCAAGPRAGGLVPAEVPLLGGSELPVRDFFMLGVIVGVVLLSLGSLLHFLVRISALRAAEHYERFCGRRLLTLASRLPSPKAAWASRIFGREPIHVFFAYARTCGFVTRQIVLLLPSFTSLIVGSVILLLLDAATTLLLALLAAAVFLAQYPLNNLSAQASSRSERRRRDAMRLVARLLVRQRTAAVPLGEDSAVLDRLFAKRGEVRRDISLYGDRIRGGEGAQLVSRIGGGVLLAAALLLIGGEILAGERTWAEVAVYVVVARYVLKDFASAGKFMSGLSRQCSARSSAISASSARLRWPIPSRRCRPRPAGRCSCACRRWPARRGRWCSSPARSRPLLTRDRQLPLGVLIADHAAAADGVGPVAWIDAQLLVEDAPLARRISPCRPGSTRGQDRGRCGAHGAAGRRRALSGGLAAPEGGGAADAAARLADLRPQGRGRRAARRELPRRSRAPRSAGAAGGVASGLAQGLRRRPLLVLHRDLRLIGQCGESVALLVGGRASCRLAAARRRDPKPARRRWRQMGRRIETRPRAARRRGARGGLIGSATCPRAGM